MILESILGVLSGLLGPIVTSISNYLSQKLKNAHDEKMAELNMQMMKLEAEMQIKVQESKVAGEVEMAEIAALKESYKEANTTLFDRSYMEILSRNKYFSWVNHIIAFMFAIVDFLKQLARPIITYYLLAVSSYLTLLCYRFIEASGGSGLKLAAAEKIFADSVNVLLYLTVTVVVWWFADRRLSKFMMRLNDGNSKAS